MTTHFYQIVNKVLLFSVASLCYSKFSRHSSVSPLFCVCRSRFIDPSCAASLLVITNRVRDDWLQMKSQKSGA